MRANIAEVAARHPRLAFVETPQGSFADARKQKAYGKLDLSLRYEDPTGKWEAEAFVTNATNEMVKTDASWIGDTSTWVSFYNPPRTFGIKAAYRF